MLGVTTPQTRAVDKHEFGLGRCRRQPCYLCHHYSCSFQVLPHPDYLCFWELSRGMLWEGEVRDSQGVSGGCEAAWLWTVLHRGLWVCWHSRGTVVWEQLSHLAPAESRWYLTGWLLNSLCVCLKWMSVSMFICVEKYTLTTFVFLFFSPFCLPLFLCKSLAYTVLFLTLIVGPLLYPAA